MKLKRRRIKRGRVEIIPMIDTIVILLVFYMTFSRFAEAEKEGTLTLPNSRAGEEFKQLSNQVIINMFDKDKILIAKEKHPLAELPMFLSNLRAHDPVRYANLSVILRGSQSMTYADLSAFMNACAKAKIMDVTFATQESK